MRRIARFSCQCPAFKREYSCCFFFSTSICSVTRLSRRRFSSSLACLCISSTWDCFSQTVVQKTLPGFLLQFLRLLQTCLPLAIIIIQAKSSVFQKNYIKSLQSIFPSSPLALFFAVNDRKGSSWHALTWSSCLCVSSNSSCSSSIFTWKMPSVMTILIQDFGPWMGSEWLKICIYPPFFWRIMIE